jgi:hypothetical protein
MKATEVTRRYHDAWNGRDLTRLSPLSEKTAPSAIPIPIPVLAVNLLPHM